MDYWSGGNGQGEAANVEFSGQVCMSDVRSVTSGHQETTGLLPRGNERGVGEISILFGLGSIILPPF